MKATINPHTDRNTTEENTARDEAAELQSLVERSIAAWNTINFVGTADQNRLEEIRKNCDKLRRLPTLDEIIFNGAFWFFQLRSSFLSQSRFLQWSSAHLSSYVLLPIDYGFVNNVDCFFVSHYWLSGSHPDPDGSDLRLFQSDLAGYEWSYVWVDWTCMPQAPRTAVQRGYFRRMLRFIPMLVRDCGFMWHFREFQPRAWVLYEVAEYVLNHTEYVITDDVKIFLEHIAEMFRDGVRTTVARHGYSCTNGADMTMVIGWLEVLVILKCVVPDASDRQAVMDWINRSEVGTYRDLKLDLKVDKVNGIIEHDGTKYHFAPVFNYT